ncbi:MAG TPA: PE/PPE C-terminal domain-containing protein [Mycobacterium sp.]|nr:PE/PPE C-terminal domain-containing protein [Mycobacterium sp.]
MTNLASSSFSPLGLAGITQIGADAAVIHSVANGGVVGPFGGVIPGWGEGVLSPAGIAPDILTPGAGISAVGPMGGMGLAGQVNAASAAVGRASLAGALSVPQGWAAAIPAATPPATGALVSSWTAAPAAEPGGMPGMPGMPMAGSGAGRGYGLAAPRYGFKLTVMGRPVVAG